MTIRRLPGGTVVSRVPLQSNKAFRDVAFSNDGELMACMLNFYEARDPKPVVKVLALADGRTVATFRGRDSRRFAQVTFAPDRDVLAATSGGTLYLWPFRR